MLAPYKQEKMVGQCKLANIFFHPHGGVRRCDSLPRTKVGREMNGESVSSLSGLFFVFYNIISKWVSSRIFTS